MAVVPCHDAGSAEKEGAAKADARFLHTRTRQGLKTERASAVENSEPGTPKASRNAPRKAAILKDMWVF
jgi:hypothetical protein